MELDPYGSPARGLRRYVWSVAESLGVGPGCCYVQLESPVQAYIPLDDRLPALPGSDIALIWGPDQGWAVGVEDGPDVVPLGRLGGDVLPRPAVVAEFVKGILAGQRFAEAEPPEPADGELTERLAAYAPRFPVTIPWAYQLHDRTTGNRGARQPRSREVG
jgi:hypothetical protein